MKRFHIMEIWNIYLKASLKMILLWLEYNCSLYFLKSYLNSQEKSKAQEDSYTKIFCSEKLFSKTAEFIKGF